MAFEIGGFGAVFDNPNVPHGQFNVADPTIDQGWESTPPEDTGPLVNTQPLSVESIGISTFRLRAYERDFYHGIWMLPNKIDFSFVPSAVERTFHIWNSHRVGKTLDSITEVDTTGLTLDPNAPPTQYLPDEIQLLTVQASPDGPPQILGTYTFDFQGELVTLTVEGVRVVGWTIEPNWINPIIEKPEWKTDLQRSYNGREQRRQLKAGPRVAWEFTFDTNAAERRLLDNILFQSGGRIFAMPIFTERTVLTDPLSVGSIEVEVSHAGTDFHAGGLAMLLGENSSFEAAPIEALTTTGLLLTSPLEQSWKVGDRLYPARAARLTDSRGFSNLTADYSRGIARFKTLEEVVLTETAEPQYRGRPVLTDQPNWRVQPLLQHTRLQELLDYGTGKDYVTEQSDQAFPTLRFLWTALDRIASEQLRDFVWNRRGRQKSIWMPTWTLDMVAVTYEDSSRNLDVEYMGLVSIAAGSVHRKDIRIEMQDGTVFYRRLGLLVTVVEGEVERATLDTPLGQDYGAADFKQISWLMLMRSESDSIEIAWQTAAIAEVTMTFRGPKHDV